MHRQESSCQSKTHKIVMAKKQNHLESFSFNELRTTYCQTNHSLSIPKLKETYKFLPLKKFFSNQPTLLEISSSQSKVYWAYRQTSRKRWSQYPYGHQLTQAPTFWLSSSLASFFVCFICFFLSKISY